jgi:hypothetical protein
LLRRTNTSDENLPQLQPRSGSTYLALKPYDLFHCAVPNATPHAADYS